jgi:ATP-dependent Zn protease
MLHVPANKSNEVSNETKHAVDEEVKRLLTESYARSKALLNKHNKELKNLAEALLEHETLTADEIKAAMKGNLKKL